MFRDLSEKKLVETNAKEILRSALETAFPKFLNDRVEQVKIPDCSEKDFLRESAILRREPEASSKVGENIGGVAGGLLPLGKRFESAAAC